MLIESGGFQQLAALPPINVLLTNTKVPRKTSDLVAKVGQLYKQYPEIVKPIFDSIEAITNKFVELSNSHNSTSSSSSSDNSSSGDNSTSIENNRSQKSIVELEQEIVSYLYIHVYMYM